MDYKWTTVKARVLFVCIHNSARSYRSNPNTDSRVSINFWLFSNALLQLLRVPLGGYSHVVRGCDTGLILKRKLYGKSGELTVAGFEAQIAAVSTNDFASETQP